MTTTKCECCGEEIGNFTGRDPVLGNVCKDCCEGAIKGASYMAKFGIIGCVAPQGREIKPKNEP